MSNQDERAAFEALLAEYFELGVAEGAEWGNHDTGAAQRKLNEIRAAIEAAEAEIERLRGLHPEIPQRPPHNNDASHQHPALPRYGLRWNGPGQPVSVPMADGYWTPFHMALAALSAAPSAPGAEQAKPVQAMTDEQWHAELWKLAVRKGLVTVHSVLMDERNPGTRCSWIQGHDKASGISNDAAAWGVKLEGGV